MTDRPHVQEPWLSRRHWRRLVEAYATGRITRTELEALKRKLTRVREGVPAPSARVRPLLRVLPGGRRPAPPPVFPHDPTPLEAA